MLSEMVCNDSVLQIIFKNGKYFLLDHSSQLFWVLESNNILEQLAYKNLNYTSVVEFLSKRKEKYSEDFIQVLTKLRKFQFFSQKEEDIQAPKGIIRNDVTQIYINPSSDCNLDCWFCYAKESRARKTPKLSYGDVRNIIQAVLDFKESVKSSDSLGISIGFTEEISLNFRLFQEIFNFIEQIREKYNFPIFLFAPSTNLMEVADEFIDFINKYKFLTVSIDIENKKQIAAVTQNITKFNSDVETHLIIPFHAETENIDQLYSRFSMYFDYISLRPVRVRKDSKYPWSIKNLEGIKLEISKLYMKLSLMNDEGLLSFFRNVGFVDYFFRYFKRIIERQKLNDRCLAGKSAFSINSAFEMSPCSSLSDYEDLTVGISNLNIEEALEVLQKRIPLFKETECSSCYISNLCGGPCMDWVAKQEDKKLSFPSKIECDFNKHIVEENLFFISELIMNRRNLFERIIKEKKLRNRLNYPLTFYAFSDFFS